MAGIASAVPIIFVGKACHTQNSCYKFLKIGYFMIVPEPPGKASFSLYQSRFGCPSSVVAIEKPMFYLSVVIVVSQVCITNLIGLPLALPGCLLHRLYQ